MKFRTCKKSRFNRTILECKVHFLYHFNYEFYRFNRTILECKENDTKSVKKGRKDLIEPYWNVKKEKDIMIRVVMKI